MAADHLPATASIEDAVTILRDLGYVIIDELVPPEVMDKIQQEVDPYMPEVLFGNDNFLGKQTKRVGSLIARSPTCRDLVMNQLVLGITSKLLERASSYQVNLTQLIELAPGSPAQKLHQDELVWDMYDFPTDYHLQCNTLWAMTDYTEEMGATRIVPRSQEAGKLAKFSFEDTIPAVMKRGSVLIYTGKVYHGAGENKSNRIRQALNLTYCVGWVRQEENQYLSCPIEVARTLPEDLLKLMGYRTGSFALGYIRDFEDPMVAIRDDGEKRIVGTLEVKNMVQSEATSTFLEGIN